MHRKIFRSVPALVLVAGCGMQSGTFAPQGFHESRYDYEVRYKDPSKKLLMLPPWRLDNYEQTSSGMTPKRQGFYQSTFEFDTDKDQRIDTTDTVPSFDLRFQNVRTRAVVWIRTIPAPSYESRTALYVLSRDYMAGVRGAGYELAQFGFQAGTDQQFAVQLFETTPARVAGLEALAVTMEVASLRELKLSPQAKRTRVKIVLIRAGLTHRLPATDTEFPAILVGGLASQPEFFSQSLPDFHGLLGRIVINDHSGFRELQSFKEEAQQ